MSQHKPVSNAKIAKIFREIADYLDMDNVPFKPQAYRRVADNIERFDTPLYELYRQGGKELLKKTIPGVGEGLAKKLSELFDTGKLSYYDKLKVKIPVEVEELIKVEGLGPKGVKHLWRELKIRNLAQLEKAARLGKISKLEGFGKRSEERILHGIDFLSRSAGRISLEKAAPLVEKIEKLLRGLPSVKRVVTAGSWRRKRETIGDLDVIIVTDRPQEAVEAFVKLDIVEHVYGKGPKKVNVRLKQGLDADLRIVNEKNFGASLQYFTGSKAHNITLRELAIKKGYTLNEYGLFKGKNNIACATEKEIYAQLGLAYIPPELRTDTGEIEAAIQGKLPELIGYDELKGDLQVHSTWSDGSGSIAEMAEAARALGHQYIAITDHSPSLRIAGGVNVVELKKQWREIDALNKKFKDFTILKGAEVDILKNGRLDYPDQILKKLDIVLAGIHSHFHLSMQAQTERIIKAMNNPWVDVIAHPTGRIIGKREGYEVDVARLIKAAQQTGTLLEIDAYPERLDLADVHIREAVENRVRLVINTDAHHIQHLEYLEYGIAQARRGWAGKQDIVNTLPLDELKKRLKRNRFN